MASAPPSYEEAVQTCGLCKAPTSTSARSTSCAERHSTDPDTRDHKMTESPRCGGCKRLCGDGTTKWCLQCGCWLCENRCLLPHSNFPMTSTHTLEDQKPTESKPSGRSKPGKSQPTADYRPTDSNLTGGSKQADSKPAPESKPAESQPTERTIAFARFTVNLDGVKKEEKRYSREEVLLSRLSCCVRVYREQCDLLDIWIVADRHRTLRGQWSAKIKMTMSVVRPRDGSKTRTETRTDTLTNNRNQSSWFCWMRRHLKDEGLSPGGILTCDVSLEVLDSQNI